ncbi:MAG TPA: acyl-CoA dehydrogenase family protein [Stellaceae bacterium]|nr:acyl-CoA dehydrogenase family protein [Stellaceae bacterium]
MQPTAREFYARAEALLPAIRAEAEANERNRVVAAHLIQSIRQAELFRIMVPRRFGGYEQDGELAVRIAIAFAGSCASTGWCAIAGMVHPGLLAGFPIEAQQEIWAPGPDVFICGSYAPVGRAVPEQGGYRLSGTFAFASGCDHAQGTVVGGLIAEPGKPPAAPHFFFLPAADYRIDDNWFTSGLSGTGSKNLVVENTFVPRHRMLSFAAATSGDTPGSAVHDNPLYRIPLLAYFPPVLAATAVGAAKGALADYIATIRVRETRGAVAGGNARMADFATIQLRVADAAAAVDAAETILLRDIRMVTDKARAGQPITIADRIACRRGQAYATKLAIGAVEALNASTGGNGLFLNNSVQRAWRDANAVGRHISLNWDTVGTMFGQHALGLEPRGQY